MTEKQIVKGKVEAVSAKAGREGLKIGGEWFDAMQRTAMYVKQRKPGDMVFIELEKGKIAFVGDLKPDESPKEAPQPPKVALTQQERGIIAQSAEKGAVRLTCAVIAASYKDGNPQQLEEIAGSMTERLAARLERDIKRRLGA